MNNEIKCAYKVASDPCDWMRALSDSTHENSTFAAIGFWPSVDTNEQEEAYPQAAESLIDRARQEKLRKLDDALQRLKERLATIDTAFAMIHPDLFRSLTQIHRFGDDLFKQFPLLQPLFGDEDSCDFGYQVIVVLGRAMLVWAEEYRKFVSDPQSNDISSVAQKKPSMSRRRRQHERKVPYTIDLDRSVRRRLDLEQSWLLQDSHMSRPRKTGKRQPVQREAPGKELCKAHLLEHHRYSSDRLRSEPTTPTEIEAQGITSKATASRFFDDFFDGHAAYVRICDDETQLRKRLEYLAGDVTPEKVRTDMEPLIEELTSRNRNVDAG